jgi:hypothetical protein
MDETTAPGSPHDLLLRLAGRVDDDLLADARELVAVGEDGHALELVTAALAADGAPLPPSVRAELVAAARTARIDLDAEAALAPAASDSAAHRFTAQLSDDTSVGDMVRQLPDRLRDGVRLRLAWRLTPAGSAPGPLPYPVLLVETPEGGRPSEVLAYQIAAALTRSGVHATVEVLTSGRPMPAYHAAALRDSVPLDDGTPPLSPRGTPSPPELVESVMAEVVEEVTASRRSSGIRGEVSPLQPVEAAPETPVDLFAPEESDTQEFDVDEFGAQEFGAQEFVPEEPAPRPVPMRTWPGGRKRRAFGEPADDQDQPGEQSVTSIARTPLPSPVPLARRTRPGPVPRAADGAVGGPTAAAGGPSDALGGPLRQPLLDPLLDPTSVSQDGQNESEWASEWASGDWAVGAPVEAPADATSDTDTPVEGIAVVTPPHRAAPIPFGTAPSSGSANLFTSEPPAAAPRGAPAGEPGLLKPESLARLSDADRELLARLQAEMVAGRSEQPDAAANGGSANGSGAHALREPIPQNPGGPQPDGRGTGASNGFGPGGQGTGGPNSGDPNGAGPGTGGQSQPGYPANPPDLAG